MPPPYEFNVYANVTDLNVTDFPAPPLAQFAHFFAYIPDDPTIVFGERLSAGSAAGLWLRGPTANRLSLSPTSPGYNPYFPEYDGLAVGGNHGVGAGPGGIDMIADYCVLDISAAPAAGTPVSNIPTIHWHAAQDQPDPPYAVPPTVVTLTPHVDPLGVNNYIDVGAEERFSPDSRLPVMWYRWLTAGVLNGDGSITPPSAEITNYADIPFGPRQRTFTYGPVPNGFYQFACIAFEPICGRLYATASEFAGINLVSDLGDWTVGERTTGKVAAGRSLTGARRLG